MFTSVSCHPVVAYISLSNIGSFGGGRKVRKTVSLCLTVKNKRKAHADWKVYSDCEQKNREKLILIEEKMKSLSWLRRGEKEKHILIDKGKKEKMKR